MKLEKTNLDGFYVISLEPHSDVRGKFVKTFNNDIFSNLGLKCNFYESYFSISKKNVLRGLHFQRPPAEHTKLVFLTAGSILDLVVDLRNSSPSYGEYSIVNLDSNDFKMLYIPEGFAHGFYTKSKKATVVYMTTTVHSPDNDSGIKWDSLGIPWPTNNPIISDKDKDLVTFEKFKSPFR